MDYCLVLVTAPAKEATPLQETLVKEKLVACVNAQPVRSCYIWEGKLEQDDEVLLMMKTKVALFDKLSARIQELHSYDTPEILAIPILKGNPKYLAWMDEVLQ